MNVEKILKAKKQLLISLNKGFISKREYNKEIKWINEKIIKNVKKS